MTQDYIIDFVEKEARRYRELAKFDKEPVFKKTDLKTAAIFDLIGEMLSDYLFEKSRDRKHILSRHSISDQKTLEKAG